MSLSAPATVEDLFDRLAAYQIVAADVEAKGLTDQPFIDYLAGETSSINAQIAKAIKFDPGTKAKVVRTTDGRLFAYDQADGKDSFELIDPLDASTVALDGSVAGTTPPAPTQPGPPVEQPPVAEQPPTSPTTADTPAAPTSAAGADWVDPKAPPV